MVNTVGNYNPTSVWNTCVPKEGNKTVPVLLQFSSAVTSLLLDMTLTQQENKLSYVQSMYVDNSANSAVLTAYVALSQQLIVVPPYHQGYFAFMVPNPSQVLFSTSPGGSLNIIVHVMNFPVNTCIWNTDPAFSATPLNVTDPVLDALLAAGNLPVLPQSPNGNGLTVNQLQGTLSATGQKTATGATTVFTPSALTYFNLKHIQIGLSGNASLAAPGQLTIQLRQNTTVIKTWAPYLPGAAPTPATIVDETLSDAESNYWSTVAAESLNINFNAALASGSLWYNFDYALTTIPG